jgi:hypothetical protein
VRLTEWFKNSPLEWSDIVAELQYSLNDGMTETINKNCEKRDYMSGYCGGLQQAIDLKKRSQVWDVPKDDK